MSKRNPWLGWVSYDENSVSNGYNFVGRSGEISELFSLIDNNLLVTLYGKSGIGKSSILSAGIFPSLRAADYVPVLCRCTEAEYPQFVIDQIKTQCDIVTESNLSDFKDLGDFFKNVEFIKDNRPVFPVLVFDQFEDWFRINKRGVEKLLSDIAYLISNDYCGITNYRFLISIREDYLYLLEDCINRKKAAELKQNRYRLNDLTESQAQEIFDLGVISHDVKKRLLDITKDSSGFNPGLISFFCHELYCRYPDGITSEAIEDLNNENDLIEDYYNRCFQRGGLSKSSREYIENHLQEDGLRRPQNLESVARHISAPELERLLNGENKLLRKFPVGEDEHIELVHDRLASIINIRLSKDIEDRREQMLGVTLTIYFIALGYLLWTSLIPMILRSTSHWIASDSFRELMHTSGYGILIFLLLFLIPIMICRYFFKNLTGRRSIVSIIIQLLISLLLISI